MRVSPPERTAHLRDHPWWKHVPPASRARRRREIARVRIKALLLRRRVALFASLLFYAGLCLLPLGFGQPLLTVLALLPLLVVPPVIYMAYLIAWHEFHR
jgi:hypothetical protein